MSISKSQHESFAEFFSLPTRDRLRQLLQANIGETDYLDFKSEWPDLPKLAKHILAIANSGGGALVIGVMQHQDGSLSAAGLPRLVDKSKLVPPMSAYLPKDLDYQVLDFVYTASEYTTIVGKKFQVLLVEDVPHSLPFLSLRDGDGIRSNAIYVRSGASSTEASHDQVQAIINRRVETGHSNQPALDLQQSIQHLRTLDEVRHYNDSFMSTFDRDSEYSDSESSDFRDFLEEAYEAKKTIIWSQLGIR